MCEDGNPVPRYRLGISVRESTQLCKSTLAASLLQSISGILANGFAQVIERLAGRQRNAAGQNHRVPV